MNFFIPNKTKSNQAFYLRRLTQRLVHQIILPQRYSSSKDMARNATGGLLE
jgi:hypothetical protein